MTLTSPARKNVTVHPAGPGFLGALALLFIGAKLFGAITWPWVWVLSPLWIPVAGFVVGLSVVLAVAAIYALVKK